MTRVLRVLWLYLGYRLRAFWLGILVPISLIFLATKSSWPYESHPERLGLVSTLLQIGGLLLVAKGYLELRQHFGRKPTVESIRTYLKDLWSALLGRVTPLRGVAGGGSAALTGDLSLVPMPGPTPSLERRVELLEESLKTVKSEVSGLRSEMSNKYTELLQKISEERAKLDQQIRETRALLETITIGGLGSEVTGWFWLLASVLISGFGPKS